MAFGESQTQNNLGETSHTTSVKHSEGVWACGPVQKGMCDCIHGPASHLLFPVRWWLISDTHPHWWIKGPTQRQQVWTFLVDTPAFILRCSDESGEMPRWRKKNWWLEWKVWKGCERLSRVEEWLTERAVQEEGSSDGITAVVHSVEQLTPQQWDCSAWCAWRKQGEHWWEEVLSDILRVKMTFSSPAF